MLPNVMNHQWNIPLNAVMLSIAVGLLIVPARGIAFSDLQVSGNIRSSLNHSLALPVATSMSFFQATPVGYVELDGDCETTIIDKSTRSLSECASRCEHLEECVGFSFESVNLCYIKATTCVSPKLSNRIFYAKTSACGHCYGVASNGAVQDKKGSCYLSPINTSQCMMNGFVCSETFDTGEYSKCSIEVMEDDWGAPPIIGDYDPDKVVVWEEESSVPRWVSSLIAMAWISMVAGMPLIAIYIEGRKITRIQMVTFAIMWVVFLGGVYLFTNVLLFQSIHFKRIRSLTTVEAVYLLAQILTTVGYGDITPAKPRGQVFIAIYVLVSLVVIANVTTQVASLIAQKTKRLTEQIDELEDIYDLMVGIPLDAVESEVEGSSRSPSACPTPNSIFHHAEPPTVKYGHLKRMIGVYSFFVLIGVLFWHFYPGEGKTWLQGIYMSVITLSTVGFGAFTPATEAGKVFAAFWMLWGSMALVGLVGAFADTHEMRKKFERWNPDEASMHKKQVIEALDEKFLPCDFLKQYVLTKGLLKEAEVDDLETLFQNMGPNKAGTIKKAALAEHFASDSGIKPHVAG